MPVDVAGMGAAVGTRAGHRASRACVAGDRVLAMLVDSIAMPAAAPVVQLGPAWLIGEGVSIFLCLLPAQLLAAGRADRHLWRALA